MTFLPCIPPYHKLIKNKFSYLIKCSFSRSGCCDYICCNSTGTILEKDAYFPSLMDRYTSRLIFCKMIRYTLYYHLSPVVEFSHGAFFC